jgi:hypothetical protein
MGNKVELLKELGPVWVILGFVVMGIVIYTFFERE